jgi:group I intron endonuclease
MKNKIGGVYIMIIYKATNNINGKSYIGQTKNKLKKRQREHLEYSRKKNVKTLFGKSIKRYGFDNFTWEILEKCNTQKELNLAEIWYIKHFNTLNIKNGYNMTLGSIGGNCGNQFTKLSKNERSKIHYLNKMKNEERENHLNKYNRKENHYTKRCMSKEEFDEWIIKRTGKNGSMYGRTRKHSEETKKKMSESSMGVIMSDCVKRKIGNANRGSNNGMSKTYKIYNNDGTYKIIKGISNYCKNMGLSLYKLQKEFKIEEVKGGD